MKPLHPAWNWTLLLLLGLSSYLAEWGFGMVFPFIYNSPVVTPDSPPPYSPSVYPWTIGLVFSALTAVIFLLCLRDAHERRAAFAAFGLSALLTGPVYVLNAERLAQLAPPSPAWPIPHLPIGLTILCWGASAALIFWWLRRSISITRQGRTPMFLFGGLLLILLLMPGLTNRCGIESLRIFTMLPANADAVRDNKDALTHFLVNDMAGSIGDICAFLIQWIGIAASVLTLLVLAPGFVPGRFKTAAGLSPANPFPGRSDLIPLLLFVIGGLLFPAISSSVDGLSENLKANAAGAHHPIYADHAEVLMVQALPGLVFLVGSWLLLRRIRTAPELRFEFTLLMLGASALLSGLGIFYAPHAMKAFGAMALILCIAQGIVFFHPKRRVAWISSTFTAPSETALGFTIQGSVMLAVLASAFMGMALGLAMISVMAIRYLIDWGNALKPPHGVAPVEEIAPAFAPSLSSITVVLGPVYFTACLFIGIVAVLLFSICYSGIQGCAKLCRRVRDSLRPVTSASSGVVERRMGDAVG